jgi:hypothetical protein
MTAERSLHFETAGADGPRRRAFRVATAVIAGWTGRDPAALQRHIEELEKEGVRRPRQTPEFYRVGVEVLTQAAAIQVVDGFSSGEVEAWVLRAADGWWVGVGSDHTDRRLEGYSVTLSKQACPKPLAASVWPLDEVAGHWDELRVRSWIVSGGHRELYQDGTLDRNRHPSELIQLYEERCGTFGEGTLMLCGTQPAHGGIRYAERFELELVDPRLDRRLSHAYDIEVLPAEPPETPR